MQPPFDREDAFAGLEGVSHIWLQFLFHENAQQVWRAKVRPPRLGGNRSLGVFATRSPFRPNGLGLSVVRYLGWVREKGELCINIAGLDLLDQTPVVDIKPYVPYADLVLEATNAVAEAAPSLVPVGFSVEAVHKCAALTLASGLDWRQLVVEVLQQDPRPAYHKPLSGRIYGCRLFDHNVRWTVKQEERVSVYVINIEPSTSR